MLTDQRPSGRLARLALGDNRPLDGAGSTCQHATALDRTGRSAYLKGSPDRARARGNLGGPVWTYRPMGQRLIPVSRSDATDRPTDRNDGMVSAVSPITRAHCAHSLTHSLTLEWGPT